MSRITTSTNFKFIQESFIDAKIALKNEIKTGVEDVDRLKGIGLEGASRTGKSWDICAFVCHYASTYSGKQINICRDHLSTAKKTIYETLKKVWALYGFPMYHFNKSATDIIFNGNTIRFVGVNDDLMTSHGLESDLLIINEAMGIDSETADNLEQRCNEFFIYDYNPSEVDCWVYTREKRVDYRVHRTTIFDNPYAPKNAKQKILSYAHPDIDDYHIAQKAGYTEQDWDAIKDKNVRLETANKYMWEVYGLGKKAVGEELIFPGWETYSDDPDGSTVDWFYPGGDFGFKVDPTACIGVTKVGNTLYLKEYFYETGLLNNDIADRCKGLMLEEHRSIWDKAEEKSVYELRSLGLDAWYSDKGAGSVAFGIQKMHQFNLKVHENSSNLQSELKKYRWAKDRQGNYKLNTFGKRIPVDKDNHAIDAIRYVILYNYFDPVENES